MKNFTLFSLIFVIIQASSGAAYSQAYPAQYYQDNSTSYKGNSDQDDREISYQTFYDDLSPYGQWIDYPGYGYVWSPSVDNNFKPYASNGYWVYTDLGWTWVSGYSWGWAAFHYGRWFYDNDDGWLWQPGYEWAPAWVSWRSSSDYYGWAPLTPSVGFSISIGSYNPPVNYWCFAPHEYVTSPHVYDYCVSEKRNTTIVNNATIVNNTVISNHNSNRNSEKFFAAGPRASEVERFTHNSIRQLVIRDNNHSGAAEYYNNEIRMFRPGVSINVTANSSKRSTPAHVEAFRGFTQNQDNGRIDSWPGFNNHLAEATRQSIPANENRLQFNSSNTGASVKQDNRPFFSNSTNHVVINNQPVQIPVENGRKSFLNDDNRSFQQPVQQQTLVASNQRQVAEMPFFRNNSSSGNAHMQNAVPHQKPMNMQPQMQNMSVHQFQPNSSFGNKRGFNRKER
jgi:hypothetical protein